MIIRFTFFLICLNVLRPIPSHALWTNFVVNYSRSQYKAGSQNWQITQHNNNWMYFANKMGILEYTGERWDLYPIENHSDTRSILKSKDNERIYVGGANEIGYISPDTTGRLKYHCLSCNLPKHQLTFGSIWGIQESDNSVYFIAEQYVIKYNDGLFSFIESPEKIDCSNQISGALYIGTASGLYTLIGEKFYKLQHTGILKNKRIKAILPFKDKVLVGTASDGFFMVDEHATTAFHTDIDAFIKQNELFSVAVNGQYIAVGTILKGVALINLQGKLFSYFNESHGLQNNTVLSLFFDNSGNLWLGLDNGIDYISLNNSISELYRAPRSYGAGYAAALYKNRLYLGTNRGLYYLPWPIQRNVHAPELQLVESVQGQVWDICAIDDELFCSLDKRLFILSDNKVKQIDEVQGVWLCRQSLKDKSKVWVSTYNGLLVLEKVNAQWGKPRVVEGFKGSLMDFEEDEDGRLWTKTPLGEVQCIVPNDSMTRVLEVKNYGEENQLPYCNSIAQLDGKILFVTQKGIYTRHHGTFERYDLQQDHPNAYLSICNKGHNMWLLDNSDLTRLKRGTHRTYRTGHHLPLVANFEKIYPVNDSLAIICNENGFALWNSAYHASTPSQNQLHIVSVSLTEPRDTMIYCSNFSGKRIVPTITFNNAITFQYNLSNFDPLPNTQYRFQLDGEDWSGWSLSKTKTYSNLPIGEHVFTVESLNERQTLSDSFAFTVLPPWYRTTTAYAAYLICLICLFIAVWYIDSLRMTLKRRQMELCQKKEMRKQEQLYKAETAQKEREIIKLKNEHLELEIKHKSQELANIAINLARKNELLSSIKQDLGKLKNSTEPSSHQRQLLRLNNKINEGIQQDDSLTKFEEYFDTVHNNFIQRLSDKYPTLSINEKRMCAFIKMELSSKEMAPLLNMSVRGVETIRYRLRKKFDLSRDENLICFLKNI